jgi:hypothetical protein
MAPRSTLPKEHKMLMGRSARKRLHAHSINDNIEAYAKKLFNNRQSKNQAAPEPIFVGPNTGSDGLANGSNANLGFVTRLKAVRVFSRRMSILGTSRLNPDS